MKILITGAGGMLGRRLSALPGCVGLDRAALDITDRSAVAYAVTGYDAVINAAAWTDVDGAETREAEATALNGAGPANLAAACAASGAALLQVSTDYVFAGTGTSPYPEDAPTAPVNAYGRSKLAGEQAVLGALPDRGYVVRTAWLYDRDGRNFLTTMLRLAADRETLEVVDDQRGQPTGAPFLAAQLVELARAAVAGQAPAGIYHGTAGGETTWFGFARAIFAEAGLDPDRVRPTTTDRFPRPAPRPAYSVLGHRRWASAGLTSQPDWRDELRDVLTGGR
ncbi:dTDP-4-dehydrorhamnose reductase [Hamadaea sp. NPDC050747]|uniref:dTDP-4-dehydrorhamnose reductase n=1 Tax=Hamadaea sp. NPDC050747 TaxID=3155789 RepID=UPI0033E065AA